MRGRLSGVAAAWILPDEALNCREVERITETSRRWEAPTGFTFTISMSEIDSETLAGIVETVLRSAEHSPF